MVVFFMDWIQSQSKELLPEHWILRRIFSLSYKSRVKKKITLLYVWLPRRRPVVVETKFYFTFSEFIVCFDERFALYEISDKIRFTIYFLFPAIWSFASKLSTDKWHEIHELHFPSRNFHVEYLLRDMFIWNRLNGITLNEVNLEIITFVKLRRNTHKIVKKHVACDTEK